MKVVCCAAGLVRLQPLQPSVERELALHTGPDSGNWELAAALHAAPAAPRPGLRHNAAAQQIWAQVDSQAPLNLGRLASSSRLKGSEKWHPNILYRELRSQRPGTTVLFELNAGVPPLRVRVLGPHLSSCSPTWAHYRPVFAWRLAVSIANDEWHAVYYLS